MCGGLVELENRIGENCFTFCSESCSEILVEEGGEGLILNTGAFTGIISIRPYAFLNKIMETSPNLKYGNLNTVNNLTINIVIEFT